MSPRAVKVVVYNGHGRRVKPVSPAVTLRCSMTYRSAPATAVQDSTASPLPLLTANAGAPGAAPVRVTPTTGLVPPRSVPFTAWILNSYRTPFSSRAAVHDVPGTGHGSSRKSASPSVTLRTDTRYPVASAAAVQLSWAWLSPAVTVNPPGAPGT